jgi:hypothetical protein
VELVIGNEPASGFIEHITSGNSRRLLGATLRGIDIVLDHTANMLTKRSALALGIGFENGIVRLFQEQFNLRQCSSP